MWIRRRKSWWTPQVPAKMDKSLPHSMFLEVMKISPSHPLSTRNLFQITRAHVGGRHRGGITTRHQLHLVTLSHLPRHENGVKSNESHGAQKVQMGGI